MTYLEAAITVLKGSRKPLSVEEITEAAMRKGLIKPSGRTPVATMSATLYVYARSDRAVLGREYRAGRVRAIRDSVRWKYVG